MRPGPGSLLALALGLAGCAFAPAARRGPPSAVARAQATHEYPSAPGAGQKVVAGSASAAAAVAAFANAYINWGPKTGSRDLRALAARSVGQARSALELAAAQMASDYELQRGGIANQGVVEALAPLRGGRDQYVVVTREVTTATATTVYQGLGPAWHVAIATAAQAAPGRWVVSQWQPES